MACYYPLQGYRSRSLSSNGKRPIVFNPKYGYLDLPVKVPCGQCIGCRLERSRQWAIRCVHEAQLHEENSFITLTYSDDNLPVGGSLDVRDFQLFIKRLRKKLRTKIRYYHCGEYGETTFRPHYHAIIFGYGFPDKTEWQRSKSGELIYRSATLEELWPQGHSSIGAVSFKSAAYVARYVMKKITGKESEAAYEYQDEFGEIHQRKPEYTTMSRRPGIAKGWYEKFHGTDVLDDDFVVMDGVKMRPPRYYDGLLEAADPAAYELIKKSRRDSGAIHAENNTPERLKVREKVQNAKLQKLTRDLE